VTKKTVCNHIMTDVPPTCLFVCPYTFIALYFKLHVLK